MSFTYSQKTYTFFLIVFIILSFLPQTYFGTFAFSMLAIFALFGLICDYYFTDEKVFDSDPNYKNWIAKNHPGY